MVRINDRDVSTDSSQENAIENLSREQKEDILMKIDSNLIIKECVKCTGDLKYHYISKFDDNEKNDQNQIIPAPIKPQRARHCQICDRCCMLMDHHCFWIGNCVGLKNQKFFFQYGMYIGILDSLLLFKYYHLIKGIWSTFKIFENW